MVDGTVAERGSHDAAGRGVYFRLQQRPRRLTPPQGKSPCRHFACS